MLQPLSHYNKQSYLTAFRNFNGTITNNNCNFLVIDGIGLKNTGTVSSRAYTGIMDNIQLLNLYGTTAASYYVFDLNGATGVTVANCITEGGTRGIHTNNFSGGTITNHLSIDNTEQGFQKGASGNLWVIKNALYLGPGAWTLGSGWLAATDYNASSDTTAVGANSLQNRTTADLVDYAGNDYRTKSSSALATAGDGGTFIGYKLEASTGIEVTGQSPTFNYSAISAVIDLTGEILINAQTPLSFYTPVPGVIETGGEISITAETPIYSYAAIQGLIDLTGETIINAQTPVYTYQSVNGNVDLTGEILIQAGTPQFDYQAISGTVLLQGNIDIVSQTPNYSFSAVNGRVILDSGKQLDLTNLSLSYSDDGITINYNEDTITASYADDGINISYKG